MWPTPAKFAWIGVLCAAPSLWAAAASVRQWEIWEISLHAARTYANPYLEFDTPLLSAAFVHTPSGREWKIEGFWDGGRIWKVRFAPPLPGAWTWRSVSRDAELHDRRGALTAVAPSGADVAANRNYRGHVKVGPSGRYFTYADGTPFFLLGDTLWSINTLRCGLGSNADGPFYKWLQDRKAKGFNSVFLEYFDIRQPNEGGYPFPSNTDDNGKLIELNSRYFHALDERVRALWNAGFVIAGHPTWVGKRYGFDPDGIRRASRYLMARYGAFNLIWSLSGEYQYSYTNKVASWTPDGWRRLGRAVQSYNAFRHPVTVHPSGRQERQADPRWPRESARASSAGEFHNESWLDHNWLQTGHATARLWRIPSRIAENYRMAPVKPVVHSEGFYENHRKEGASAEQVRWQAWVSLLSGAAGHGYGATGIWQFHDPADATCCGVDRHNSRTRDGSTWKEALRYPGSAHLKHFAALLERITWWELEPAQQSIRVDGAAPDTKVFRDPYCAASRGKFYILYIPAGNAGRKIDILAPAVQGGRLLDPRTGAERPLAPAAEVRPPDDRDWVVIIGDGRH